MLNDLYGGLYGDTYLGRLSVTAKTSAPPSKPPVEVTVQKIIERVDISLDPKVASDLMYVLGELTGAVLPIYEVLKDAGVVSSTDLRITTRSGGPVTPYVRRR